MKKCVRCGIELPDDVKVCEECGFDFDEYENVKAHTIKVEADPFGLSKEEKVLRIEHPILTILFGMAAVLFSLLIIATYSIIMMALGFLFSILAIAFSSKESLVKLKPLQNVGKWFGYIGFVISLFSTVYIIMGLIF